MGAPPTLSRKRAVALPPPAPGATAPMPASVFGALILLCALSVGYGALESLAWPDRMWGAHFYAFFPAWVLPLATALALAAIGTAWFRPLPATKARREPDAGRPVFAVAAALAAGVLFWLLRERHLFWGDALPLSINLPKGQSFHPDEPLTMFVHHLLYTAGGGRWAATSAVAAGSIVSGMVFAGWSVWWWSRRVSDRALGVLATAVILAQGFVAIFFGHVEDYSYLAVVLLFFLTSGVDFLEGRGPLLVPLLMAVLAYALHILGGLTMLPALVLVAQGLRNPAARLRTALSVAGVAALLAVLALAVAPLYGGRSPLAGLFAGATKVLAGTSSLHTEGWLSPRQWMNLWSQFNLLGPLSLPWLAVIAALLLAAGLARNAVTAFVLVAAGALLGPRLFVGEGALGAARDWDIFSAPAVAAPVAALVVLLGALDAARARRLMVALLAASLFHTAPWIALNTDLGRTMERVARLPLPAGRGETMIGTYYLNSGDLPHAETWFRRAIARDSLNVNSQSGLGVTLARQQRLAEAVTPMVAAVTLRPGMPSYMNDLVVLLFSLDRANDAEPLLREHLTRNPADAHAWLALAECANRRQEPDSAIVVLEDAHRQLPADAEVAAALADAYEGAIVQHGLKHELAAARALLDRFAAAFPNDPRVSRLRVGLP